MKILSVFSRKNTAILLVALSAGLLAACSGDSENPVAQVAAAPAKPSFEPIDQRKSGMDMYRESQLKAQQAKEDAAKAEQQATEARIAKQEKANRSTPFDRYQAFESQDDIMYLYKKMATSSPRFEMMAARMGEGAYKEKDAFKRKERIAAFESKVKSLIDASSGNRYRSLDVGVDVASYDFENKIFKLTGLTRKGAGFAMGLSPWHWVTFSNADQYGSIPVEDEQLARKIESLRAAGTMHTRIYFFVSEAVETDAGSLESEITRVELIDKDGTVLATL